MIKKSQIQNLEVFISTEVTKRDVYNGVRMGRYRKIASRLYTTNFLDTTEAIVQRNIWSIVGQFFPSALITDRTSLENKPSTEGLIYLISDKTREIKLPGGFVIKPRKGFPPLSSDRPFMDNLFLPSLARAFLENMHSSRTYKNQLSRTLSQQEIEEKLEQFLQRGSQDELNKLRDQAQEISLQIGLQKEYQKLDNLIGSLLGTRSLQLQSALGRARVLGVSFDKTRSERLQKLFSYLGSLAPQSRLSNIQTEQEWRHLSFFEAYFSNFIEGTKFDVFEAEDIIFKGSIPINRPQDAHDVIGTYKLVSSKQEMTKLPKTSEEFIFILKNRHAVLMKERPDKRPGVFKEKANRVGQTLFVDPLLVEGTLKIGFDLYKGIEVPFYKAVFIKFLISEIHPFDDGNGRLARIMMNAELTAHHEEKIIIPTIYRGNYLSALSSLTNNDIPDPLVRVLDFAQKYTTSIQWKDLFKAQMMLEQTNAFLESNEAETQGIKLKLPIFSELVI